MPVNIKGKEYVTVAERMELLRQSGKQFEMVESKAIQLGERVAWQVSIMIDSRLFIGSAEAHLNAKPGSADATDPFACAETSAIGRALGLAGFGSLDSIASADEIVRNQDDPPADAQTMDKIRAFCKSLRYDAPTEPMTQQAAANFLKALQVDYRDKKKTA